MNSTSSLRLIVSNADKTAVVGYFQNKGTDNSSNYSSIENGNSAKKAMIIAVLLHLVALFWLIYNPNSALPQQPVLSFTMTMMDLSSSPNTISSAASSANSPAEKTKAQKKIVETKTSPTPTKQKKVATPEVAQTISNKSPLSFSSQAQTAVLSPLTPAQFDAAYLQNPAPKYPPLSRRMGEQGNVMLRVYVNEQGQAGEISVRESSGFERLDAAALEAVKRWRFIAAKQNEQLIASWVQVPIKFILE